MKTYAWEPAMSGERVKTSSLMLIYELHAITYFTLEYAIFTVCLSLLQSKMLQADRLGCFCAHRIIKVPSTYRACGLVSDCVFVSSGRAKISRRFRW